ncbi:MAG: hypothetical protein ACE5IP_09430 [Terriglobia bacterium]
MPKQTIGIPQIELSWSAWTAWNDLKVDARHGMGVPVPNKPGVYEVKYIDDKERLTIGKTSNLRGRIKQGLVKGNRPHSTGQKIRPKEDLSRVAIRWALTDRPGAAEEELHKRYIKRFKRLPKYTEHT